MRPAVTRDVEVVAAALEAFRARDPETLWGLMDPEAEFHSVVVGGDATSVYRGRSGIDRYFVDIDEVFEDWHTEDERFHDAGPKGVVSVYRVVGSGRGSGVPIDLEMAIVWTLREHRIAIAQTYLDIDEAMRSVGLEGPPTSEEEA
jgi:ketosteroid isomerase-like protein